MATKYITNSTPVDLEKSREVWNNGKMGDLRLELWADEGNEHVWIECDSDPISDRDGLIETLVQCGISQDVAEDAVEGNLDFFEK